jgi:hypothetical protein
MSHLQNVVSSHPLEQLWCHVCQLNLNLSIPTCTFTSINCKNTLNRLKNNNFRIILIIIICLILTHFFVLDRYGRRLGMITRLIWKRSFFNLYIAWLCIVQKVCVPVSTILVCIDKRSSNFCCMEICLVSNGFIDGCRVQHLPQSLSTLKC